MEPTDAEMTAMACENIVAAIRSAIESQVEVTLSISGGHVFIDEDGASVVVNNVWANVNRPNVWCTSESIYFSNGVHAFSVMYEDISSVRYS